MKCPKCGYVSFDHLQNCKKCGDDLSTHKARFNVGNFAGRKAPVHPLSDPGTEIPAAPAEVSPGAPNPGFNFTGGTVSAPTAPAAEDLPEPTRVPKPAATVASLDTFLEESTADALLSALAGVFPQAGGEPPSPGQEIDFSFDAPFPPVHSEPVNADEFMFLPPQSEREEPSQGDALEFTFERQEEPEFSFSTGGSAEEGGDEGNGPAGQEEQSFSSTIPERPTLFDFPERAAGEASPWALPEREDTLDPLQNGQESQPVRTEEIARIDSALEVLPSLRAADSTLFHGDYPRALQGNFSAPEAYAPDGWPASLESPASISLDDPEEFPPGDDFPFTVQEPATPLWRRIAASLADYLILGMLFFLFVLVAEAAIGGTRPIAESFLDLAIPYFLVLFCLSFGYFTLFHFLLGQTLGKLLFRLQVAGNGGDSLLFSQAFLRSTGGLLSLLPAGLGFLVIPFDRQGRGWNDRLAGTRVISAGPGFNSGRPPAGDPLIQPE